jgi:hypothetical protein
MVIILKPNEDAKAILDKISQGSMSLFLETKDNREQRHTVEEIEMTPENKQAVEKHVQEIAKIL